MKLKFFAREDLLVAYPGLVPAVKQPRRYVGRKFDAKARSFPAVADGESFDSDSKAGKRLVKIVSRDAALWPADAETAAACGVQFVAVDFKDGVFHPASQPTAPKSKASAVKDS